MGMEMYVSHLDISLQRRLTRLSGYWIFKAALILCLIDFQFFQSYELPSNLEITSFCI